MKTTLLAALGIICLLESTSLQAQTPPNLTNNLIAFYTFEGNANDMSGIGNNATPAGNYQFVSNGLSGNAFRAIGDFSQFYAGGGHLLLPAFTSGLNSGFTYSLWVKNEAYGNGPVDAEFYISFNNGTADSAFKTYIALVNRSPAFADFFIGNGGGAAVSYSQPITLPAYTNGWKHFAVSYSPGSFACYFNGTKVYQTNATFNAFPAPYAALNRHWWPSGSSARMSVTYDNVRVFNRALTDLEVEQLNAFETKVLPYLTVATKTLRLSLFVELGKTYQVESSSNLQTWTPYGSPFVGVISPISQDVEVLAGSRFFRITEISP